MERGKRIDKGRVRIVQRRLKPLGFAVVLLTLLAAVVGFLLGPAAWAIAGTTVRTLQGKERADALNSVRQTLLAATAGSVATVGLGFTVRTFFLSRRGQITDRYSKAVAQLASDKMEERLGGIYALEHIMIESERDHRTVLQVLAAFIRTQSPRPATVTVPTLPPLAEQSFDKPRCPADVQAALTVIAKRPSRPWLAEVIDLSFADLSGADLKRAALQGADLNHTVLIQANLLYADLRNTDLRGAVLFGSTCSSALISEAVLARADLRHARLARANFNKSSLVETDARYAALTHANLSNAKCLKTRFDGSDMVRANLTQAYMFEATFDGAVLYAADAQGADFREATIGVADLRYANFRDADLTGVAPPKEVGRQDLEELIWKLVDNHVGVFWELIRSLDIADQQRANVSGLIIDDAHLDLFRSAPPSTPMVAAAAFPDGYALSRP